MNLPAPTPVPTPPPPTSVTDSEPAILANGVAAVITGVGSILVLFGVVSNDQVDNFAKAAAGGLAVMAPGLVVVGFWIRKHVWSKKTILAVAPAVAEIPPGQLEAIKATNQRAG